jgi:Ca-activated chloride channel family protein
MPANKSLKTLGLLAVMVAVTVTSVMHAQSGIRVSEVRPRRVNNDNKTDPQDERPVKLSANLVTVLASVSNTAGGVVTDLSKEDFAVFEDDKRQEVSGFYREDQMPLRLVFLFDTSSSIRTRFDFERRAAGIFFKQVLRPGDQVAIFSVGSDPKLEIGLSSEPGALSSTLERLQPGGATALYGATLDAAKLLQGTIGRHVIVVLSDGEDTSSPNSLASALNAVQRSDSVIYCVHSMGVLASDNPYPLSGEAVLKSLSLETGGLAFFPPINSDRKKEVRDLDEIYRRIAADIKGQYLLTYYSNANHDGRFRAIRLQMSRPDLNVRARRGYYAGDE